MSRTPSHYIESVLCWSSRLTLRFPLLLILLFSVLAGFTLNYTAHHLGVNTNTSEMLSPALAFQKNRKRIESEFPQDAGAMILVVEAATPEQTAIAASHLAARLKNLTDQFLSVYIPTDNAFFRQQALLFLSVPELDELAGKLIDAQPFIGYLSQHYRLEGLFDIIEQALKKKDDSLPMDLNPLLRALNQTVEQQIQGRPVPISWQNLLAPGKLTTGSDRILVIAKPKMNFAEILPAAPALKSARTVINRIMADNPSVRIRITGEVALEHEELESVTRGAAIAGTVSLILVCSSLLIGLRSFKLMLATFIALIMGLILTAGFAAITIGHLNLISIAFAVLYIGLGVDYALHLCLHYRENVAQGMNNKEAIQYSIKNVGVSLFLCALTTAIGFLAFIPTDYSGVSELGIISGAGMFIGLVISLVFLPALLQVLAVKNARPIQSGFMPKWLVNLPFRHALSIRISAVIIALLSTLFLTQLRFDSNPINMRDPHSESVSTIKELLRSQTDSPFSLVALAPNLVGAEALARRFSALPSVHEAIVLSDMVAKNQDEKLYIIEDLALVLGNQLNRFPQQIKNSQPLSAIHHFIADSTRFIANNPSDPSTAELTRLVHNLTVLVSQEHARENATTVERNVLSLLPYTMNRLRTGLTAQAYKLSDIPAEVTANWRGVSGLYKVLITPEYDLNQAENLRQFVADVQSVDPSVSGLPVADQASGKAVVKAFIEAFSGALIAIFILLVVLMKSLKNTLLIIAPLLLAGLMTGAANVALDNSFNFANIIALPLMMGMGVDSGIHILHRLESESYSSANVLTSSSARGVFFSSLTTLCSFSSLAFTPHLGTASMGLLLAIGISFTLLCTLIVLPAFYGKRA